MRNGLQISKNAVVHYFLIFIMLSFQGSLWFRQYNNIFVVGAILLGILVYSQRLSKVPQHYILFLILLLLSLFFEIFITNGGVSLSSVGSIMSRFMIVLAAFYWDEEKFPERFVKISILFATFSLVCFGIEIVSPEILKMFMSPHVETVTNYWKTYNVTYYSNLIFAFTENSIRNLGIYHEPGLYQIVLNTTLYLLLFKKDRLNISRSRYYRYLIITIASIITCMSTTGYIGMIVLFLIYFLFMKNNSESNIKWLGLGGIIGFIFYCFFSGENNIIYKTIISKVTNASGEFDLSVSTGHSRIMSLLADIQVFKEHPFGIGYLNYNDTWKSNLLDETISDVSSCVGLTQILAILGIGVTVLILGYYVFLMLRNLTGVERISFILMFLNTCLAQPQVWFPAMIVLLLINEKTRCIDEEMY